MKNYIVDIYKKFLYGNVSRDEFLEMTYHLNNSSDEELSNMLEDEWNEDIIAGQMDLQSKNDIRSKLDFYIDNEKKKITRKWLVPLVAAMAPLLIIAGAYFVVSQFSDSEKNNFMVSVERGNKAMATLPDESKVWINSNSEIEYTEINNTRNVNLNGEAFFKVTKDKSHPFVVTMNNLHIEVLGTSFNVKSRANSDIIEASLVEGSIKIYSSDLSQDYYLKPNEKAIYNQATKRIEIVETDNDLETAWKDNKLKFSSERFIDVMSMLEDWYGVKIVSKYPDIENDLISGSFNNENLETTLEVLKLQYNIRYVKDKDTIFIVSK